MLDYPENFLRGVSNKDLLTAQGISAAAFYFEDHGNPVWLETSINWEDDAGALPALLSQKKKDEPSAIQFKVGAVRVPRSCLAHFSLVPRTKALFSYERRVTEDGNKYHGNILLKREADRYTKHNVAAWIALNGEFIPQAASGNA